MNVTVVSDAPIVATVVEDTIGLVLSSGTDGTDGKTILNGSGAPSSSLGTDGDFYIDTVNDALYGPKTAGVWGSATSLVGPAGAAGEPGPAGADSTVPGPVGPAGADGKTVLNGSGAPSAGLGTNGDFYIDTAASTIYGPKAGGAWGSPVSLIGPAGETGPAGADSTVPGPPGADGTNGTNGVDGKTVLNGTGAPSGGLGTNGDFYIDTASSMIYGPKAGGAWGSPVSLVGPAGADGAAGADGTNGTNGIDGKTVLNGTGAPSGGLGTNGDFYIDTTSSTIYGPNTAGAWGSPTSLVGPAGPAGADGASLANASTLAKITESAGAPLWDGSAWPGGGGGSAPTRAAFVAIESDFMFTTIPGCTQAASASGSSASWYAGASHPGIATLKCSSLANSGYQYSAGGNSIIIGGGEKMTLVFQHLQVRATAFARYGFQNSAAIQTAPATGIYFDITGNGTAITLTGRCRNSSTETATATSCTLTAGTWYTGTIEVASGVTGATFTIYSEAGAQLWQETVTTNLPGSTTQTSFQLAAGDTSTAGGIDIAYLDYIRLEIARTLTR